MSVSPFQFPFSWPLMGRSLTESDWGNRSYPPPGQLIDLGGYRLHLYTTGQGKPTIIFDQSLGSAGWAYYLVFQELAKTNQVVVFDRAGYGWSDPSPYPRTTEFIVQELETLLVKAGIEPPYVFVGSSFGGYTARLYHHRFPNRVLGMVLAHCLHEDIVLNLSSTVQWSMDALAGAIKLTQLSAPTGIVKFLDECQLFEMMFPSLRKIPPEQLEVIKHVYHTPKQWEASFQELELLRVSSKQVKAAGGLGNLPLVVLSVGTFLKRSLFSPLLPHDEVDTTWNLMQKKLLKLSTNSHEIVAPESSHFVWVDAPDMMVKAIRHLLDMIDSPSSLNHC